MPKATRGLVRTPKAAAKPRTRLIEFRTKCLGSAMRLRIAFRTSRLRVHNLDPFSGSSFGVKLAEAFCYRTHFAIANLAIV